MRLIIEERRAGHPDKEEALLASHVDALGVPVVRMTWKPFERRRFAILPSDVVAGSVRFVRSALQALGKDLPRPNPYPPELKSFLRRDVWEVASLGTALKNYPGAFVKPARRWKLFTGFIPDGPNDGRLHGVSRREPVWCSEPVRFLSEWRVYVIGKEIVHVGHSPFGGDKARGINLHVATHAIRDYRGPSAYAIDFGVLDNGVTALIEVNDGFSVGAYDDIPAPIYFGFIRTRWTELAGGND